MLVLVLVVVLVLEWHSFELYLARLLRLLAQASALGAFVAS